jgi:hypothetical protein
LGLSRSKRWMAPAGTRHLGGVAGGKIVRHAEPPLQRIELTRVDHLGGETCALQVLHPAGAAAAARVLVHGDDLLRRGVCAKARAARRNSGDQRQQRPARWSRTE